MRSCVSKPSLVSYLKLVRIRRWSAHAGCFNTVVSTGILRSRLPVAAKIALATAGPGC